MFAVLLAAILQGVERPDFVTLCNVVTSNGVTVCGSKFPPTVSKHYKNQHSAIHKTIPTIWNTNNPSCCDIQGTAPSVQHHGSLCSQPQMSLLWCLFRSANIHKSQCHTIYSSIHYGHFLLNYQNPTQNVQLPTYNSIYCSLNAYWSYNLHSSYNGKRTGIN